MSGTLMNVSASTSGTATPRSRIDALSRDDLLRFVKKQIEKFKAAKSENDELKNQLEELRKNYAESQENLHAEREINNKKAEELENIRKESQENLYAEREINNKKTEELENIKKECDNLKVQCSNLTQQLEESGVRLELAKNGDKKSSSATKSSIIAETDVRQLQVELASVKDLLREQMEKYDKQLEENERLSSETAELRSLLDDATLQLESLKELRLRAVVLLLGKGSILVGGKNQRNSEKQLNN
ncbi:unnamed protein product [Gongylonema pulchrum]|uniref:Uncharacterized protein n=1 Tax=Gongylonema pulchrum TaxID=637853 RepID=A0A183E6L1_9BILA|nr:unnamed protein product [Gongylonema pulchrum]